MHTIHTLLHVFLYRMCVLTFDWYYYVLCSVHHIYLTRRNLIAFFNNFCSFSTGHLMGKKSIDESLDSVEQDSGGQRYLTTAEVEEYTQPSGFLQALITALAGPERARARGRERDTVLRQQRALEQRNLLEEQLEREREQASLSSILKCQSCGVLLTFSRNG
uniref:Uncharacterized protein n=1 Tax=Astyanax mexicanus TaxID=7994 RepID=A0A8B9KYD5_ASTMX